MGSLARQRRQAPKQLWGGEGRAVRCSIEAGACTYIYNGVHRCSVRSSSGRPEVRAAVAASRVPGVVGRVVGHIQAHLLTACLATSHPRQAGLVNKRRTIVVIVHLSQK